MASRILSRRSFSTTSPSRASVLFALSSLSNSRETQHFNKLSHLSRVEHSPPLKLIQTSEVDAFPLPSPPPRPAAPLFRIVGGTRSARRVWDEKALQVGRVVLASQDRTIRRLQGRLEWSQRREARQLALAARESVAWQREARRLRSELRTAGVWILLSIGTATALATWRFWPQQQVADSAAIGRKIAEKAKRALPLPAAMSRDVASAPVVSAAAIDPALIAPPPATVTLPTGPQRSWWKGLFWRQE